MSHSVYEGLVIHERQQPKYHRFQYHLFQVCIDLDDIDSLNRVSPLWSVDRFNLVQFKRSDYMAGADDLKTAVTDCIYSHTQQPFEGKIHLLTNLRYWGYCFNPVSFYFCYTSKNGEQQLDYILAEINNTPWGECHTYVLDVAKASKKKPPNQKASHHQFSHPDDNKLRFDFDKEFHVSPFLPMDLQYRWFFTVTDKKVHIHMELYREVAPNEMQRQFFASMNLLGKPLSSRQANRLPFRYPLLCLKIISAIHWQALKLWCKRIPFINHPSKVA